MHSCIYGNNWGAMAKVHFFVWSNVSTYKDTNSFFLNFNKNSVCINIRYHEIYVQYFSSKLWTLTSLWMVVTVNLKVGLLVGKTVQKLSHNKKRPFLLYELRVEWAIANFLPFCLNFFFWFGENNRKKLSDNKYW